MNESVSHELADLLAAPPAVGGYAQFCEGAKAAWRGWKYLRQRPRLWRYAVLPVALNILITGLVLALLVWATAWFVGSVHPRLTGGQTGAWWWAALAGEIVLAVALLIVCGGAAMLAWKLLSGILCGYFYGRLAEQVERQLGLPDDQIHPITLWHEIVDTVLVLGVLMLANGFFLLLNLVPIAGGVVAMIGSTYVNWFVLGLDYLNFPLALRGWRRRAVFEFARRRQWHTLGLGAVVFLFEFVPILGAVFLTTAVVGAVLLHRRLEALDHGEAVASVVPPCATGAPPTAHSAPRLS